MSYWRFLAIPTLIAALLSIPKPAPAQVSINIGPEPVCRTATMATPRTTAPLMDTQLVGPPLGSVCESLSCLRTQASSRFGSVPTRSIWHGKAKRTTRFRLAHL
jgi:hypothetical protein